MVVCVPDSNEVDSVAVRLMLLTDPDESVVVTCVNVAEDEMTLVVTLGVTTTEVDSVVVTPSTGRKLSEQGFAE